MNQITTEEQQLPPPPQPPLPNRNSTSCERHPDEVFTGFCPSCLCERLVVLDSQCAGSSSVNPGRKSASAALKSLFRHGNGNGNGNERGRVSTTSFLPELRRTKSFSGDGGGGFLGFYGGVEPQRKSCDVRGRSTLFSLFNQEISGNVVNNKCGEGNSGVGNAIEFDCESGDHVNEAGVDADVEAVNVDVSTVDEVEEEGEESEIKVVKDVEMGVENERCVDFKTMKDYIEIDTSEKKSNGGGGGKDLKEKAGSFWSAASVFSKKLKAWTKKNHKRKKNGVELMSVSGKKGNAGRNCRDTQSEIADYGFGRRSCDTDPRFSLDAGRFSVDVVGPGRYSVDAGRYSVDAGRMSFDDPRGSFDEPRASWDGYLIGGGRTGLGVSRMVPPMVSLVEDAPVVGVGVGVRVGVGVSRNDMQIPVEEPSRSSVSTIGGGDECGVGGVPGGAAQTKDYYSDSSSKRRKSLDRSSSIRKTAAAVVAEMDELKSIGCNGKVAPPMPQPQPLPQPLPTCVDYLNSGGVRDLNLSSNSLRDNYSESFDLGFRDNGNGDRKGSKKPRKWRAWNIWSLLYRRSGSKDDDDDKYSRSNGVGRSLSESWQDYRRNGYGGRSVTRSNSSVSWRNSYNIGAGGGSFGSSIRQGSIEVNGHGRKKRDEFVLERNRSARYSPKHGDNNNGMLRFYLTPMRGSRRGGSGKPKPAYSHSFARNMLRLY